MKPNELPDLSYLNQCFEPDYESGVLVWKRRPRSHFKTNASHASSNAKMEGKQAGTLFTNGYMVVRLDGIRRMVHRIIFKLNHGFEPECVDHVNGVKTDNRMSNLRGCTFQQNTWHKMNEVEMRGINVRESGKYRVTITKEKKQTIIGTYDCLEEAKRVRYEAEIEVYGDFRPFNSNFTSES